MTVLKVTISGSGMIYIPKLVRDCFGRNTSIITNAGAAVMYPSKTEYEDVLASLEIIKADVQHRITLRDKATERRSPN